jgi:hypothetical protein
LVKAVVKSWTILYDERKSLSYFILFDGFCQLYLVMFSHIVFSLYVFTTCLNTFIYTDVQWTMYQAFIRPGFVQ